MLEKKKKKRKINCNHKNRIHRIGNEKLGTCDAKSNDGSHNG